MRRTVTIDDDIHSKIQKIRAKQLMETGIDYPYCRCLNDLLKDALNIGSVKKGRPNLKKPKLKLRDKEK